MLKGRHCNKHKPLNNVVLSGLEDGPSLQLHECSKRQRNKYTSQAHGKILADPYKLSRWQVEVGLRIAAEPPRG